MTAETEIEPSSTWLPEDVWFATAELTRADRCDRCAQEARVRLRKDGTNLVLDLCRHHWIQHFPALTPRGWRKLSDTLAELEQRPGASA